MPGSDVRTGSDLDVLHVIMKFRTKDSEKVIQLHGADMGFAVGERNGVQAVRGEGIARQIGGDEPVLERRAVKEFLKQPPTVVCPLAVPGDDDAGLVIDGLLESQKGAPDIGEGQVQSSMAVLSAQKEGAEVSLSVSGCGDPAHRTKQAGLVTQRPIVRDLGDGPIIPRRIPADIEAPKGRRVDEKRVDRLGD